MLAGSVTALKAGYEYPFVLAGQFLSSPQVTAYLYDIDFKSPKALLLLGSFSSMCLGVAFHDNWGGRVAPQADSDAAQQFAARMNKSNGCFGLGLLLGVMALVLK